MPTQSQINTNLNLSEEVETGASNIPNEFDPTEIAVDPGLRKSIEEYDINIRDIVRREYLLRGPCQPIGHVYPKKIEWSTKKLL